jgi:hypothetical protein
MTAKLNMARLLEVHRRVGEAEGLYREVAAARAALLGPGHPSTMEASLGLADLLLQDGRVDEAAALKAGVLGSQGELASGCAVDAAALAAALSEAGVVTVDAIENCYTVDRLDSVDHPCKLLGGANAGAAALLKGKRLQQTEIIDTSYELPDRCFWEVAGSEDQDDYVRETQEEMCVVADEYVLDVLQPDGSYTRAQLRTGAFSCDDVPIHPPWHGSLLLRSGRTAALRDFLRGTEVDGTGLTHAAVLDKYRGAGVCVFVFGGAVRDALCAGPGLPFAPADVDVVFGADVFQMVEMAAKLGIDPVKMPRRGKATWGGKWIGFDGWEPPSGVVLEGAPLSPCFGATYAGGLFGASTREAENFGEGLVSNSLKAHLLTLDFCCNSLFFELASDTIIDPSGSGVHDCVRRQLRIPAAEEHWPEWLGKNSLKLLRYWKMRARGFEATDQRTHRYILRSALDLLPGALVSFLEADVQRAGSPPGMIGQFLAEGRCRGDAEMPAVLERLEALNAVFVSDVQEHRDASSVSVELDGAEKLLQLWGNVVARVKLMIS